MVLKTQLDVQGLETIIPTTNKNYTYQANNVINPPMLASAEGQGKGIERLLCTIPHIATL